MKANLLTLLLLAIQLLNIQILKAQEKEVYIPKDLLDQDFENPNSQWSRERMKLSTNFTLLWEKGYGKDITNAPDLNGRKMSVDIEALAQAAEKIYDMYKNEFKWVAENSNCDKYRMLIFLKYDESTTAWGGSRDNVIGAITSLNPRVLSGGMNIVAHELGHAFQQQIGCDKKPHDYFGGKHGFCEMCSQWGLWHYNNDWVGDELYHLNNYVKKTHKPFFHRSLCGCSPYVLEYLSEKYGVTIVGKIYREGHSGEDVTTVYKRLMNLKQEQYCDELFDAFCHTVNLDFKLNWEKNRELGLKFGIDCNKGEDYWQVPVDCCPESYGYNAINIDAPQKGQTVKIQFEGIVPQPPYISKYPEKAGWRYGFVMVDTEGKSHYGEKGNTTYGSISFSAPQNIDIKKLWLVVMGAPKEHWDFDDDENLVDAQWPYRIKVSYEKSNDKRQQVISVEKPGDLKGLVESGSKINNATSLKVIGNLNGTDFLALRYLAGRSYDNKTTNGVLQEIDLSEANIVDGGEKYSNDVELDESGTIKNVFPAHGFQDTNIKKCILPETVNSIGRYAFGSCHYLEEVISGDNVKKIDFAAFTFSSMNNYYISDAVEELESCAFYRMDRLRQVYVGNGIVKIPQKSFFQCKKLQEVTLGINVSSIEKDAFADCQELKSIICLNDFPQDISENAFSHENYEKCILYVPGGTTTKYRSKTGWKRFKNIVEIGFTTIDDIPLQIKQSATTVYDLKGHKMELTREYPKGKIIVGKKILIIK